MSNDSKGVRHRLMRGGKVLAGMRVYSMLVNLVLHAFLARVMDPGQYGILLVSLNTVVFLSLLAMCGFNTAVVKYLAGSASLFSGKARAVFARKLLVLWTTSMLAILIIAYLLLSSLMSSYLELEQSIVALIFICSALLAVEQMGAAGLRSLHAIAEASLFDGRTGGPIGKTIVIGIVLSLVVVGHELITSNVLIVICLGLVLIVPIIVYLLAKQWRSQMKSQQFTDEQKEASSGVDGQGIPSNKDIFRFCGNLLMNQVLLFIVNRSDLWIAGSVGNKDEVALYGSARWLILQTIAPIQVIAMTIGSSVAQLKHENRSEELEAVVRVSATIVAAFTLPVLIFMCIWGDFVLTVIYGDFYAAGASMLAVLAIGQCINCLTGNSGQVLTMSGHEAVNLIINLTAAVLVVLLGMWAIQEHGVLALAVVIAVVHVFQSIAKWAMAKRLCGVWTHATLNVRTLASRIK